MGINKKIKVMLKVEEMSQEQVNQEIKRLDSQLNKLLIIAIALAVSFITSLVLMIIGFLSVNISTIALLGVLIAGIVTNIKQGRAINLQLFLLNMFK
jgi:hypothetical protein